MALSGGQSREKRKTMSDRYICRIPSIGEMHRKWDYEIGQHPDDPNWTVWKGEAIRHFQEGISVPYYGILGGTIICEATASPYPDGADEAGEKDGGRAVELCAFRTVKPYRGQGLFSKLMDFMLKDLKQKGYTKAVVGVEPDETRNLEIYRHWGFTEHVASGSETYPDGTVIRVDFFGKTL